MLLTWLTPSKNQKRTHMKINQLALQCFTIRDFCKTEDDFRASMKKVAAIGYQAVQISAVGPIDPHVIAEICAENNLKIVHSHEKNLVILEQPDAVIERMKALGCPHTAYPHPHTGLNEKSSQQLAADLQAVAPTYQAAGITLSYHNHALEFEKFNGRTTMDILFDEAPDLAFELDTYWVQAGGASVVEWCQKCKGRLPAIHLKDFAVVGNEAKMAALGDGNINWPAVIAAAEASGCEWFIFEQDRDWYDNDPFIAAQRSFDYITSIL